jgi:hypothetical protein
VNKLLLYRTISLALSVLVLFSTMSFTIEKHYCGNNLVDKAIFSKVQKCSGMDVEKDDLVKKPCCEDVVDVLEGQDKLNTSEFQKLDQDLQPVLAICLYTYSLTVNSLPKQTIPHRYYSPPNLIKDIQLLDEVYLI